MKSFNDLLLDRSTQLNYQQLKSVTGGTGDTYTCYCGFTGGEYEHLKVQVEADSVGDALDSMNCGGEGVTCNGN